MAQLMSIKRNVEMCPGQVSVPAIYHVSQGDKGTRIILGLVNNSANYTIPDGTTATIRGHRADGTLFTEITADVETTEVKFNLTEDMSAIPGRAECEAVLASGSANVIGTANFIIDVEKSPASIGSVFPATDAAETWLVNELTNLDISGLDDESVVDAINSKANESTIAPEFSTSASYTAGSYVYKNGVLYKFTAAHSGAWTGTDAETVTVGGEVSDLKSALYDMSIGNLHIGTLIDGKYVKYLDGKAAGYSGWSLTDFIPCSEVTSLVIKSTRGSLYNCFYSDANESSWTGDTFGVINGTVSIQIPQGARYFRMSNVTADMQATTVRGVLGEIKSDMDIIKYAVAQEFSPSVTYQAGSYVWYNNELRRFIVDHTAGAFVTGETANVSDGVSEDVRNIARAVALPYNSSSLYSVGDYCMLNNRFLYRCIVDITTAESFTSAHWKRVFLSDIVKENSGIINSIAISSNPELNKIIKRLYIPESTGVDITTITRAVVFNGFSGFYGLRLYKGPTMVIGITTGTLFTGYETVSSGCYIEVGDLTSIGGTSKEYKCTIYPFVYEENGIIDAYNKYQNAKNNTTFGTYSPSVQAGQGQNEGETLTVMSYNVAHYNDDVSSVIIPDEKIKNIIETISNVNADILCIQEDTAYIDSNQVRTPLDYLYMPQYPSYTGLFQTTIRSKKYSDVSGTVTYSNGRWLGYAVFTIGNKKVLVVSTHPIAGTENSSISARNTQYEEMFRWLKGDITLRSVRWVDGGEVVGDPVSVPEFTHIIIGMDGNTLTTSDMTNLSGFASQYKCIMGNGGRLGWLKTARSRFEWYSLDNIIVSDNIIINSFESMTEKYSDLYSDHVPLVAKLTLTNRQWSLLI